MLSFVVAFSKTLNFNFDKSLDKSMYIGISIKIIPTTKSMWCQYVDSGDIHARLKPENPYKTDITHWPTTIAKLVKNIIERYKFNGLHTKYKQIKPERLSANTLIVE